MTADPTDSTAEKAPPPELVTLAVIAYRQESVVRAAIEGDLDTSLLGAAVVATVHLPAGTGIEVPWTALTASGAAPAVWRPRA